MRANRGQHLYVKINLKFDRIIGVSSKIDTYPKHWYQPPISIFNAFSYSADGWKLRYWVKWPTLVTKYKFRNLIWKMVQSLISVLYDSHGHSSIRFEFNCQVMEFFFSSQFWILFKVWYTSLGGFIMSFLTAGYHTFF